MLVGDEVLNLYIIDMTRSGNIIVFYGYKNVNFQTKIVIFYCFLQNIECGFSLVFSSRRFKLRNKKTKEYPWKPKVYYLKVGFEKVFIEQACKRDRMPSVSIRVNEK